MKRALASVASLLLSLLLHLSLAAVPVAWALRGDPFPPQVVTEVLWAVPPPPVREGSPAPPRPVAQAAAKLTSAPPALPAAAPSPAAPPAQEKPPARAPAPATVAPLVAVAPALLPSPVGNWEAPAEALGPATSHLISTPAPGPAAAATPTPATPAPAPVSPPLVTPPQAVAPAAAAPPTPPASPAPTATSPDRVPARLVRVVKPRYPRAARRAGQAGTVRLGFTVESDGRVTGVEVMESSGFRLLDEAAVAAVSARRYEPARENGHPVAERRRVTVEFRLEDAD